MSDSKSKSGHGGARPGAGRPKGKTGRPTKYLLQFAEQAYKLCLLGATDAELSNFFETTEQTINAWKTRHPEFLDSLKRGKAEADATVADRLFKRATGYSHKAVKMFNHDGEIIQVEYIEHYPPDTTACIFWLKNRQPKKWRDKVEVEAEINTRKIPWTELEEVSRRALERAEQKHRELIDGRAERLGLAVPYQSEDSD